MNKNVLITILLIIVLCLGGYLVCDKVLLNKNDNKDNVVDKEPEKDNSEKDYDLNEAEKLVDIYAGLITYKEIDKEEYYKAILAFDNVANSKIQEVYNCEELGIDGFCSSTNSWKKVNYEDLNNSYKYLFGKNYTLIKKEYYSNKGQLGLRYSEKYNIYVMYNLNASGINYNWGYKVNSAKTSGNELKVNVSYSSLDLGSNITVCKSPYTGKEYSFDETQKFVDNEYQYFDKYNFIFEYEDNHYILKDIIKI